ncbi:HvfC/BufC N-terminal domain-containing protein [Roseateles koreensis]|uniref:DNA-binding domain-containing protein n=1 Tax=Roseateles koreensis TaxID=2987526 RepID=A0ABT5KSK4_9BURK|nr:DNA-binding domain-containing protein [Roseateles koreensis]MDC8784851.1 DNA-binding domain-containing protein [Roseateles koreensis]
MPVQNLDHSAPKPPKPSQPLPPLACLRVQQLALQRAVLNPAAAQPFGLGGVTSPGLPIYAEAYRARLVAALRDNYTVLSRAMGDEAFDALARAYVDAHPSAHPSIRWFGHQLAEYMGGPVGDAWVPHPALIDFARMDWALREAFDGPDAPPLTIVQLAEWPAGAWPQQVFRLHPTVRLVPMTWAIEPAWRALRAVDPDAGEADPVLPEPQAQVHLLLVWREALETRWRSLPAHEAALLQAMARGDCFAEICEQAAATGLTGSADLAAAQVLQALLTWVTAGLLVL